MRTETPFAGLRHEKQTKATNKFGVCIDNTGYPASLEAGKLYPVIADEEAARHGYLRVIDESGEDYAYSAERFFMLDVPAALAKALRHSIRSRPSAVNPQNSSAHVRRGECNPETQGLPCPAFRRVNAEPRGGKPSPYASTTT